MALKSESIKVAAPETVEESKEDLGVPVSASASASASTMLLTPVESMEISEESAAAAQSGKLWTLQDEFKLEEAIRSGRKGLGFFVVKVENDSI